MATDEKEEKHVARWKHYGYAMVNVYFRPAEKERFRVLAAKYGKGMSAFLRILADEAILRDQKAEALAAAKRAKELAEAAARAKMEK